MSIQPIHELAFDFEISDLNIHHFEHFKQQLRMRLGALNPNAYMDQLLKLRRQLMELRREEMGSTQTSMHKLVNMNRRQEALDFYEEAIELVNHEIKRYKDNDYYKPAHNYSEGLLRVFDGKASNIDLFDKWLNLKKFEAPDGLIKGSKFKLLLLTFDELELSAFTSSIKTKSHEALKNWKPSLQSYGQICTRLESVDRGDVSALAEEIRQVEGL